jgi:hypothetical protein
MTFNLFPMGGWDELRKHRARQILVGPSITSIGKCDGSLLVRLPHRLLL